MSGEGVHKRLFPLGMCEKGPLVRDVSLNRLPNDPGDGDLFALGKVFYGSVNVWWKGN